MTEELAQPVGEPDQPDDRVRAAGEATNAGRATPVEERGNRVHWFAGRVHAVLDDVMAGGVHVAGLDAEECAETVAELTRAVRRLDALRLAVLAQGTRPDVDVAAASGATSTGAWFAHATVTPHGTAHRWAKLASRLDAAPGGAVTGADAGTDAGLDLAATRAALAEGRIDVAQTEVVVQAVDGLPRFVTAADRARAEAHLLDEATRHDAKRLKLLARHLLHVIDPDAADAEDLRRLEAEEAAAGRRTMLTVLDDGNGMCHGRFKIPSLHGAMLAVALDALASPTRPDPIARHRPLQEGDEEDARVTPRSAPELLGEAFCQLLERFPTKKLPDQGGGLVTVVVTIDLEPLLTGLGLGTLDTGGRITAGEVRRLSCTAGLIPAIFGGESELLDLGRKRRFYSPGQRLAMRLRDKACTTVGCDRPAAWCHGHHDIPWSEGGTTDVATGRLLCPRHHTLVHHPGYAATPCENGRIRITRLTKRHRQ